MIGMGKHVGVEVVVIPHKTPLEIIPDTIQRGLGKILTKNETIMTRLSSSLQKTVWLFPDNRDFPILLQANNTRRLMGLMFLTTRPTHIVNRLNNTWIYVAVVLCCRLSTDIR